MNKFYSQFTAAIKPLIVFLLVFQLQAQDKFFNYNDSWGKDGLTIEEQSKTSIILNYSINQFTLKSSMINGELMNNISLSGTFLPNNAGYPDLPGGGRYIAIPQGANPLLKIISFRTETISNVNLAPAFELPLETSNHSALEYKKNIDLYSKDALYPKEPIIISEKTKIRGVDAVMLGITPFQFNPVKKELIVYRDIKVEISFEGGNGHFGNDSYRSRCWDPILEDALLNYNALPNIDYDKRDLSGKETGYEYLIVIPNNPVFQQWADSIKAFRTEQGILTGIVKLADIPNSNTAAGLKAYFIDVYNNWIIKPAAVLLLADYGTDANSTIISMLYPNPGFNSFPSDNYYADITGDDLPDIVFARIPANNASQLQTMCAKFIDFERNPPVSPDFYDQPISFLNWQSTRWFALCSEITGGYLRSKGKHPVRINGFGSPSSVWSTATNTELIVTYFGPGGLNYIPASPIGINGNGLLVDSINKGTFMLNYRGTGTINGWDNPYFVISGISLLNNVDNKLPFVFSIASETGAFHNAGQYCFTEVFQQYKYNGQNSGALGVVAASGVIYSFVDDVFALGMFDNMWPDFMPAYGTTPPSRGALPAFGCAAGKYFLAQSSWPVNTSNKQITYRLFHMQGDAFLTMYSEVPQNLTVNHLFTVPAGTTTYSVTANAGSFIALTVNGQIVGTAIGTGSPVSIPLSATLTSGSTMKVTVTKQNYKRYSALVNVAVGINENNVSYPNVIIKPNPNKGVFTVNSDIKFNSPIDIKIYNALNVLVCQEKNIVSDGKLLISIDLSNYQAGIYYLLVENKTTVIVKKFAIIQ